VRHQAVQTTSKLQSDNSSLRNILCSVNQTWGPEPRHGRVGGSNKLGPGPRDAAEPPLGCTAQNNRLHLCFGVQRKTTCCTCILACDAKQHASPVFGVTDEGPWAESRQRRWEQQAQPRAQRYSGTSLGQRTQRYSSIQSPSSREQQQGAVCRTCIATSTAPADCPCGSVRRLAVTRRTQ
jgi:hypothetical protein